MAALYTLGIISKILQSIVTPLIPVFLIWKVLLTGLDLATTVGIGNVGGTVL